MYSVLKASDAFCPVSPTKKSHKRHASEHIGMMGPSIRYGGQVKVAQSLMSSTSMTFFDRRRAREAQHNEISDLLDSLLISHSVNKSPEKTFTETILSAH